MNLFIAVTDSASKLSPSDKIVVGVIVLLLLIALATSSFPQKRLRWRNNKEAE